MQNGNMDFRVVQNLRSQVMALRAKNTALKVRLARACSSSGTLPPAGSMVEELPSYNAEEIPTLRLHAHVVKGFGRGAKELGFPTANMDRKCVGNLDHVTPGVYFGWATVDGTGPYKAVSSVGINPFYKDVEEKTVEPHLLHTFEDDFYGADMRLVLCGFLRPEWNFPSLEALISAIENDISVASAALDDKSRVFQKFEVDKIFRD